MDWNDLQIKKPSLLLEGVKDGSWVYFVHSYRVKPESNEIVKADSDYGISVPAVIENSTLFGTQFHPEKSGKVGAIMIRNFLRECKK
jgi:glutamine amidotransferase